MFPGPKSKTCVLHDSSLVGGFDPFWHPPKSFYQTLVNVQSPSEILFSLGTAGYLSPTSRLAGLKMLSSISRKVAKVMASIRIVDID